MTMAHVAIALGSNVGDRERMLREGVAALQPHLRDVRVSTFHDTDPVGVGPQPTFLNAAAVGVTVLPPRDLLQTLLDIERTLGRERPYPGAPRTLDLDLILYDDLIIDGPGLVIPHPRFRDRAFVLRPLAEIAPEWTDPVTGRTVQDLLDSLKASHPRAT
ncbi:MAG: 2-amino-4-hydroxy-6-hydroxymethyldihydropteridine diphosphokinase [Acidobacteria bacterium RIFCSPLOWO2_12_FULL_67_14]|nr:MAG: 2-amino-4-hydroxy-6-hydroxymethyldihydropteridine diphosphokinase [Acidobacteria bacterium RIFCSPLOWO2_02_FULL_67_21]OFW38613.1 MAG: 2-amino-4-hydroxy-6-hydroxymethyldihydropteridine diphosphokinase [Acidobacteria bacterium RIFCSPLOWO2_12_FULL_67_14]